MKDNQCSQDQQRPESASRHHRAECHVQDQTDHYDEGGQTNPFGHLHCAPLTALTQHKKAAFSYANRWCCRTGSARDSADAGALAACGPSSAAPPDRAPARARCAENGSKPEGRIFVKCEGRARPSFYVTENSATDWGIPRRRRPHSRINLRENFSRGSNIRREKRALVDHHKNTLDRQRPGLGRP